MHVPVRACVCPEASRQHGELRLLLCACERAVRNLNTHYDSAAVCNISLKRTTFSRHRQWWHSECLIQTCAQRCVVKIFGPVKPEVLKTLKLVLKHVHCTRRYRYRDRECLCLFIRYSRVRPRVLNFVRWDSDSSRTA